MNSLRRYQDEGVTFLTTSNSALLADEMGLGKTVQVAVAIDRLHRAGGLRRVLIVAPASLLTNWSFELDRWGPSVAVRNSQGLSAEERAALWSLPVPITIVSYEAMRTDFLVRPPLKQLDLVVFDEAQRLKNAETDTALAARRIPSVRRWALSATPLENGVGDLVSITNIIGLLPDRGAPPPIADLIESLQGHFLRRRKEEVLPELPPVLTQDLPLALTGQQLREYQAMRRDANLEADSIHLLALINSLKQICNKASDGSSIKLDALREIVGDPGGAEDRLVIISQYTQTLDWIGSELSVKAIPYTGRMSYRERDKALDEFRKGPAPVALLLSLKAGGVGLNIPEATHAVLFDRWWNPAAEDQAIHRAHRFGRSLPLHVYRFRVVDTIEDKIVEISQERQRVFDEVVEDTLAEPLPGRGWSRQDLLRVLQ
ncbi:MAG: DEAD/DEAH box helicase [Acidimicrobiales bacterium]